MAIGGGGLLDSKVASVVVAQDGSGDYNGSTHQCIQDAIDSLLSTGGWIFIKPGTYTIGANISILTGTGNEIVVSGVKGATILDGAYLILVQRNYTVLKELSFDEMGLRVTGQWCTFQDLYMENADDYAIELRASGNLVTMCYITGATNEGIHITNNSSNNRIINNRIRNSDIGVYSDSNNTIMVNDNIIHTNTNAGIQIENAGTNVFSVISSNYVDDCDPGIKVEADLVSIVGNVIKNCNPGIYIDGTGNLATGNVIEGNSLTTTGIEEAGGNSNYLGASVLENHKTFIKRVGANTITLPQVLI